MSTAIPSATYPAKKPRGWVYVSGTDRNEPNGRKSHVYTGPSYSDLRGPLCMYGWNRSDGAAFSILRNNGSARGPCSICEKRQAEGRGPVPPTPHPTKWI